MASDSATHLARRLFARIEPIHVPTYFSPDAYAAFKALGLKGFGQTYVGPRAAPLGAAGAAAVTAAFHSWHPSLIARGVPSSWEVATPEAILAAREQGVVEALTRICAAAGLALDAPELGEAADLAWEASQLADTAGRVLGAGNQAMPRPATPIAALWQGLTTLREHRGDGHIAVLVGYGVGPVEAHVIKIAAAESDEKFLTGGRGWSEDDWSAARAALVARGWLDEAGVLTPEGRRAHETFELRTDAAALQPWTALGEERAQRLADLLTPLAQAVIDSGDLPPFLVKGFAALD